MVRFRLPMHVMLLMATRPNKPLERTGSAAAQRDPLAHICRRALNESFWVGVACAVWADPSVNAGS